MKINSNQKNGCGVCLQRYKRFRMRFSLFSSFTSQLMLFMIIIRPATVTLKLEETNDEDCPVLKSSLQVPAIKYFLPKDYQKSEIPYEKDLPLNISINLFIRQIGKMDPETMTFSATIVLGIHFRDYRICDSFSSNTTTVLHPEWNDLIWKPIIYFEDTIDIKHLFVQPILEVKPGKIIMIYQTYAVVLSCNMELSLYPHDLQICRISVAVTTAFLHEIQLTWYAATIGSGVLLPEFDVIQLKKFSRPRIGLTGNFSRLTAELHLKRRIGYFVIHIYIPSILIVVMSMLSFWMPPEATPARCALPVTSLLTLATAQGQYSISSVSYIMAIDVWMLGCIGFVFATLVEYAIINYVLRLEKMQKVQKDEGPFVKPLFIKTLGVHDDNTSQEKTEKTEEIKSKSKIEPDRYLSSVQIDKISSIIFPVLFCVQAILYFFALYMKQE